MWTKLSKSDMEGLTIMIKVNICVSHEECKSDRTAAAVACLLDDATIESRLRLRIVNS
jgi:hypothetical protein